MTLVSSVFSELPRRHYACILADPPWRFRVWSRKGLGRSPERYYPTLTLQDILSFPIAEVAADDAWLFLFVTCPFLAAGHHVGMMS